MDVVKAKIARLGARLRIATRPDLFTEFSIRFKVPA
jgi:chemotaxis protein histidine kinase CheA